MSYSQYPKSGAGLTPEQEASLNIVSSKLTTADVFSDFVASGCIASLAESGSTSTALSAHSLPTDVVLNVAETFLYASVYDDPGVDALLIKIDVSDFSVDGTYTATAQAAYPRVSPDGTKLFAAVLTGPITVIGLNTSNMTEIDSVAVPAGAGAIKGADLSPDGSKYAILYNDGSNKIDIVDTTAFTISTITLPAGTYGGIVFEDNDSVWTVESGGDSLDLIDLTDGSEIKSIALGTPVSVDVGNYQSPLARAVDKVLIASSAAAEALVVDTVGAGSLLAQIPTVTSGPQWASIVGSQGFLTDGSNGDPNHLYVVPLDGTVSVTEISVTGSSNSVGIAVTADGSTLYCMDNDDPTAVIETAIVVPSLSIDLPAGVAIVSGLRIEVEETNHVCTDEKDTYVFLQSDGTYDFEEVDIDDPQPAGTGLLTQKITATGGAITKVEAIAPIKSIQTLYIEDAENPYTVEPGGFKVLVVGAFDCAIELPPVDDALGSMIAIFNGSGTATLSTPDSADIVPPGGTILNYSTILLIPFKEPTENLFTGGRAWIAVGQGFNNQLGPGGTAALGALLIQKIGASLGTLTLLSPITAPNSPSAGWTIYVDSGDGNKLKAKASNGTVVTLGTP